MAGNKGSRKFELIVGLCSNTLAPATALAQARICPAQHIHTCAGLAAQPRAPIAPLPPTDTPTPTHSPNPPTKIPPRTTTPHTTTQGNQLAKIPPRTTTQVNPDNSPAWYSGLPWAPPKIDDNRMEKPTPGEWLTCWVLGAAPGTSQNRLTSKW